VTFRQRAGILIVAIFLLDRVTKLYIQNSFSLIDSVRVIPGFFNIVHTENPGAAFGFLAEAGEWRKLVLIWVSLVVLAIIGGMLWRSDGDSPLTRYGLTMIFGGAAGNLYDRILRGTVTDFLQFFFGSYEYPSFNAADSFICIGAGLLVLDMLRGTPKNSRR
jgi:signal peptidase II